MIHRARSHGRLVFTLVVLTQLACGEGGGGSGSTSGTTGPTDTTGTSPPSASPVRLNELTSKSPDEGPYAGMGDAIELVNPGDEALDLSGWRLSDDPGFPAEKTYEFPAGTTIAAGGYLVLVGFDELTGVGDFPFGITSSGPETVSLVDAANALVDQVELDGARAVVSYCRVPDGDGEWGNCLQTLGGANTVAPSTCGDHVIEADETCEGADLGGRTCADLGFSGGDLACSNSTCRLDATHCESGLDVAINELEAVDDRIEIVNAGSELVDLGGWILSDRFDDAGYDATGDVEKLVFAAGTALAPGDFLVIAKGDGPGQHAFGLSSDGDIVTLATADFTIVDQVSYGPQQAEISFCALPDGPGGSWTADCVPTFGAANAAP